jgi:catechol 2,3-dioxygenase-like lactoylglutathione lyase family enzyme
MPDVTWLDGVHHVGFSVADIERSVAFWEELLGTRARFRGRLERPYLGESVGYPDVAIEAALIDLPGGGMLELLDYQVDKSPNPEARANPGNVHVCLRVSDADAAWERAVEAGARPTRAEGPVVVDAGPNRGARVAYFHDPDGISFEIYQPAA